MQLEMFPPGDRLPSAPPKRKRRRRASRGAAPPPGGIQDRLAEALKALLVEEMRAPEYQYVWKLWPMPSGVPIPALRALPRKTSGGPASKQGGLAIAAQLAGWPTPDTGRHEGLETFLARQEKMKVRHPDKGMGTPLGIVAQMAGWPTPKVMETVSLLGTRKSAAFKPWMTLTDAALLAGWATPMVPSGGRTVAGERTETGREGKPQSPHLEAQALLAGWQTPKGNEKVRSDEFLKGREPNGEEALAFGPGPISSRAGTAKSGALNPEHSRWLQGFPAAWGCCAATGMPSCRR